MHFLFIVKNTNILGGVETLASRMGSWLAQHGHRVTLLINEYNDATGDLFRSPIRTVAHRCGHYALGDIKIAARICNEHGVDKVDVVKSFEPDGWLEGGILSRCFHPKPTIMLGVYSPVYHTPSLRIGFQSRKRLTRHYFRSCVKNVNRVYIGNEQQNEFVSKLGEAVRGRMWALPIELDSYSRVRRVPQQGMIVSIGRLAPMKEYNFYMCGVVEELWRRGHNVIWHVYGDGEYSAELVSLVTERGLGGRIILHGALLYSNFSAAMQNAKVFIGMGTAAVEAAACGVPTVVAVAYDRSGMTYGKLTTLPVGNLGDRMGRNPPLKVVDEVEEILQMSEVEYARCCDEHKRYAKAYSVEDRMVQFMDFVEEALPAPAPLWMSVANRGLLLVEKWMKTIRA